MNISTATVIPSLFVELKQQQKKQLKYYKKGCNRKKMRGKREENYKNNTCFNKARKLKETLKK